MTLVERAWLAGLLEGEGSFCLDVRSSGRRRPQLLVSLQMCDKDVVERAARLMDGKCLPSKRRKVRPNESPSWRVKVGGQRAEDAMLAVQEFMCVRRYEKIKTLLARKDLSHR